MTSPPSSATQSPTVGKSAWASAACRNAPGHAGRPVARAVAHDRGLAMDGDDPRRPEALGRERREGLRPAGVPAERLERVRVDRSSQPTRLSLPVRLA